VPTFWIQFLSMILSLSQMPFINLRTFPAVSILLRVFTKIENWILAFSLLTWSCDFHMFSLLIWWFSNVKLTFRPCDKMHLIIMYHFYNVRFDLLKFCLEFLLLHWFEMFFSYNVFCYYNNACTKKNEFRSISSFPIFWKCLYRINIIFSLNIWQNSPMKPCLETLQGVNW
jgi:hypothetical protein